MSIRILIADDHAILRKGIAELIKKEDNMEVVAEAENGLEAVRLACKLSPDVAVVDISMPVLNGLDATTRLSKEKPGVKVIILSMHENEQFILRSFRSGAWGYLLKECTFNELIRAISSVARGNKYISPSISRIVLKNFLDSSHSVKCGEAKFSLTAKERQVLQLLSEGSSVKEIARGMSLSVKTIESHRQHIMEKLGLHSIAELTKYALREGLTSL